MVILRRGRGALSYAIREHNETWSVCVPTGVSLTQSHSMKKNAKQRKYKKLIPSRSLKPPMASRKMQTVATPSFIEVQNEELAREICEKEAVSPLANTVTFLLARQVLTLHVCPNKSM